MNNHFFTLNIDTVDGIYYFSVIPYNKKKNTDEFFEEFITYSFEEISFEKQNVLLLSLGFLCKNKNFAQTCQTQTLHFQIKNITTNLLKAYFQNNLIK